MNLEKAKCQVKSIQPKVKVSKTGADKIGVVKLALDIQDGQTFLLELHRGNMKLWPEGVGIDITLPQPEDGLRLTVKAGKHSATLEMDAKVSMTVQAENRLAVELTLTGHLTDKAVSSLWAIQVEGGAVVDVETMQDALPVG